MRKGLEGLLARASPERKKKRRRDKRTEWEDEDERIGMGE